MCGITGWVHYNQNLKPCRDVIYKMTETLVHRGPDEYGYYVTDHALLGHRRLVVIDPEGGKQPMTKKVGPYTYTIVYNGEIYNTDHVRDLLKEKGYTFTSHCDTEVVLVAYMEWGEDCTTYLNGIFAFGVWEDKTKSLFLARDRLGVKPLFYAEVKGSFIFASEMKALLTFPDLEPVLDERGLLELFSLGPSRIPGSGVFKGIYELKPGEYMLHTSDKTQRHIYWKPKTIEHTEDEATTIHHMSHLVEDAITKQLVSDVPICTFLSGGLDSSGISSIAAQYLSRQDRELTTYSIDYEDNDKYFRASDFQPSNDNKWVKGVSQYIGSVHERVILTNDQLAQALRDAVLAYDLPGMADIDSSLMLFCDKVKQKHTVALSGECADEIFGGYPWYQKEEEVYYDGFPWNKHIHERKSFLSPAVGKLNLTAFAHEKYQETIGEIDDIGHGSVFEQRMKKLTYINLKWFMLTLLTRKDRMSMYKSLEVRVPYADHRIVEYAWNIPWHLKNYGQIEKGLLRKCLEHHLPKDVVYRKKSPYPKTYHPAYMKAVRSMLKNILDCKSSPLHDLINTKQVYALLKHDNKLFITPWFGQLMKEPQFIAYLIQLNIWLETYKVKIDF
ncbi:asparagine synthase (glutamine-hydrolyzing) [Vallitalea pronyensis]|uniref:asparagine synthase (glutamine-hydrolyzing) n=1 Tax=Vallitalea pronyensis TaxID=1348613 RepID=A0A8J8MKZ6_9FIRM|nr:asparagine synthase (glutamine-hydrolyzing) [Vallitalea pronyensis]QUI23436.1 asparagine synthase (glutamine-hydrolyzing) [Vallitalea pronyensis]